MDNALRLLLPKTVADAYGHLPMNVKLQYQTVENYNLDLWNIYNTIEQSLLNGEFTATLLGNN